jgi:hypothetical protein
LKEASMAKVMSCAKEVIRGAGAPSAKMADRPANSPGRAPWFVANQSSVMRADHH